ncbi:nephrin [Nilaparvata lugens]|nr:nephrin [Nilaparvata lugens]
MEIRLDFPGFAVPCLLLLTCILPIGEAQLQYFRVSPKDEKVQEGEEITLKCEVANLAGRVQWTKDGFALGFNHIIPGYPRYSMTGDSSNGVYNLRVVNASLEDDAEFQCQVGPAKFHKAIRANARLSVISPPSSIQIVDHKPNEKIEIHENQSLQLECQVRNAKPAASIVWYRHNVELKLEKREDRIIEISVPGQKIKRYTISSKITLTPTSDDDNTDYTCAAKHEALPADLPYVATVQLSVLYPPGPPYIEGYTEGETIRRGQTVELVCKSRGGNPPAQVIWYKNDEQIHMQYRTTTKVSENIYSFTADSSDNKARYRCEASNVMSVSPLKAEVDLTVFFAPSHVTISGPTEARVGDIVPLTCLTAPSNPPAEVKWMIGGKQVKNATQRTYTAQEGGWITTSNTTAVVVPDKRALVVICHGLNMQLTENVVSTHTINVLNPPGAPTITGVEAGKPLTAGKVTKLSCTSLGGNPLATLTWYKNDKKIPSQTKEAGISVQSEIQILTNVTDNEAIYKCEATNPATEIPLIATVTLSVLYPPERVQIRKDPEELRSNSTATLICDASSSNPPAKMTWWREGIPVTDGIMSQSSKPGLHGGTVSSIQLKLNITPDIDGIVYTCKASNEELQRSVHDIVTMNVLYKPVFVEMTETSFTGAEGESLIVSTQAHGRPSTISYTWTKDTSPLVAGPYLHIENSVLNFTRLNRSDAGSYTCEAVNSEGATTVTINITVQYPMIITDISSELIVGEGEDGEFWCQVEGNPISAENISWRRDKKPDIGQRMETIFRNNTSTMLLHAVTKDDIGPYNCVVGNGLGNQTSKSTYLVLDPVRYESVLIVRNVENSDYGRYECIARNELGFATSSVTLVLKAGPDPPTGLTVLNTTHDSMTLGWTPGFDGGLPATFRLRFRPVTTSNVNYRYEDAGNVTKYTVTGLNLGTQYVFSIMAQNKMGETKFLPDIVKGTTLKSQSQHIREGKSLQVAQFTRFSLTRVLNIFSVPLLLEKRYQDTSFSVAPPSLASRGKGGGGGAGGGSNKVLVIGAVVGASVLLLNVLLVACCLRRKTNKRITGLPEELIAGAELPLLLTLGVAFTAALLLILNITLVACFVYRKRARSGIVSSGVSEQSSSKSATIEMYAPSSYNETVTGETLSSVSEKSESYSDSNQDYTEDARKQAASTYLIEQIEYPFQYPGYEMQHQIKEAETIGLQRNTYGTLPHNGSVCDCVGGVGVGMVGPYPDGGAPYYNVSADARYVAYPPPPPVQFAQPPLAHPPPRPVPPPDVTVLTAPPPMLSTFSYNAMETEGHLV